MSRSSNHSPKQTYLQPFFPTNSNLQGLSQLVVGGVAVDELAEEGGDTPHQELMGGMPYHLTTLPPPGGGGTTENYHLTGGGKRIFYKQRSSNNKKNNDSVLLPGSPRPEFNLP